MSATGTLRITHYGGLFYRNFASDEVFAEHTYPRIDDIHSIYGCSEFWNIKYEK